MTKSLLFSLAAVFSMLYFSSCKRVGCMADTDCVENYDPRAEKAGDCTGCTDPFAATYCLEADVDNGNCLYQRDFYSDNDESGWIDVWVSDSAFTDNPFLLTYVGRIDRFTDGIPECGSLGDTALSVLKRPGEYFYETETQTGQRAWGWVLYREEGCRLLDVW